MHPFNIFFFLSPFTGVQSRQFEQDIILISSDNKDVEPGSYKNLNALLKVEDLQQFLMGYSQ